MDEAGEKKERREKKEKERRVGEKMRHEFSSLESLSLFSLSLRFTS